MRRQLHELARIENALGDVRAGSVLLWTAFASLNLRLPRRRWAMTIPAWALAGLTFGLACLSSVLAHLAVNLGELQVALTHVASR